MAKWLKSLWRCWGCGRPRKALHALEPDAQDQDSGFQRPHRRTYFYSIFAARLAIMVMLAILIGLLTILTWHFTTVYTTRSIENVAFSLRTELLQRPISRMWNLLNSTVESTIGQVQLAEIVLGQYGLPIDAPRQVQLQATVRNMTWAIFVSRKAAKTITIVYKDGQLQSFDRNMGTNQTSYIFSEPVNGTVLGIGNANNPISAPALAPSAEVTSWPDVPQGSGNISWFSETVSPTTGQAISPAIPTPSFDLTKDIEGVFLLKDGDVSWRITVSDFEETPLLSSASPVRHPETGTVLAVTGITNALSSINAFLKELTIAHSGSIYLTTADGYLLGSSTDASLIDTSGPKRKLVLANESSDSVIKAGAQWLYEHYGDRGLLNQAVHATDVTLEGRKFYIDSFTLVIPRLQMVGVIIIPRSYIMGEVDRRGRATLAILISVSSCILLVGCIFILILTSGVSTEMKLRAELINHLDARRRAEASSNYKSQFLANMSHELRTPMAAVIGLLDILLCDDCLSAEQVNMVSQIRRCSTALLRLLNNILDLSKVESGKLLLEEADFDLNRELEGLVDMFSVQCVDHDIEIVLDLAGTSNEPWSKNAKIVKFFPPLSYLQIDDMPRMVRGDSARVVQIFVNLIANSIKFTSSGHVTLRGWCSSTNAPASSMTQGSQCEIENHSWNAHKLGHELGGPTSLEPRKMLLWFEVEDTGCGIDPSKWEAVFDSFVQADPSTTRTYGGTGLGLCIVRSLVRKMAGDIKVVKKEGPGTLIRLYLEFGQSSDGESDTPCLPFPGELENAKVLLAMKGDVGRGALAQWMHFKGLQVYEASEWEETIHIMRGFLESHGVSWRNRNDNYSPEATNGKIEHPATQFPDGHYSDDSFDIQKNTGVLEVAGESRTWDLRNLNALVILDSEVLPCEGSLHMQTMLAVLDEFRDQGVMISWLLNHGTPNTLKTQLRRTGYTIMANQPVYKSKLLQLLTSMVGCLNRRGSGILGSDVQTLQIKDSNKIERGRFEEKEDAATDHHELEKLQPQVQRKLGIVGHNKSVPEVLEKWSSKKNLVNVDKRQFGQGTNGQTGLTLDIIALHQDPEGFGSVPATRKHLDDSKSHSGDLRRGSLEEEQERERGQEKSGPTWSPGSSGAASPRWLSAWPTPSHPSVITGLPASAASSHISEENLPVNHLLDIHPSLSDPVTVPTPPTCSEAPDNFEQQATRNQEDALEAGLLHEFKCSTSGPVEGKDVNLKHPPSDPAVAHTTTIDATSSTRGSMSSKNPVEGRVSSSVSAPPGSKGRKSTRNATAKKPASMLLGASNALSGIRILLAEDTPVLRRVATIMLEKMGAQVVAVGDGLEAVVTLERSRADITISDSAEYLGAPAKESQAEVVKIDLVLMDCQMPRMDGYEATKAIRKAEEGKDWHMPIVALTAHAMSSDEAKCMQVGMDAYLTKPIDCKLMVSTIVSLTKKRS